MMCQKSDNSANDNDAELILSCWWAIKNVILCIRIIIINHVPKMINLSLIKISTLT